MSKVLIFPTDTVYGIGTSVFDKEGQGRIYQIKERPLNKRLAVLCSSVEDIEKIAVLTQDAIKLINHYMPGALTIVLKTKEELISDYIFPTIAVRIPNHEIALKVLKEYGPLATTSVNISGEPAMNDYILISDKFNDVVDEIYQGETKSNVSSTIIDLTTKPYTLIREGDIKFVDILNFLNK